MKKIIPVLFIMLMLISFTFAYSVVESNIAGDTSKNPADSWWGRLISKIKFWSPFSVSSVALGCTDTPTKITQFESVFTKTQTITVKPGEIFLINWWYGSPYDSDYLGYNSNCINHAAFNCARQFAGEKYLKYNVGGSNSYVMTCTAGNYWNNKCYFEIYPCLPTSSIETTPAIVCSAGQTKCEGTTSYICSSNAWVSQGKIDGKCGYTSPTPPSPTPPPSCTKNTAADTDSNCAISKQEMDDFVIKWKNKEISRTQLAISLEAWANE